MHLNYSTRKKNGKTYRYYSIAESYRDENGVPRKKVIRSLGKLTPKEVDKWKFVLSAKESDISSLIDAAKAKFIDSKKYLDIALLSTVYDKLNISMAFKLVKEEDSDIKTEDIAKILILSRCLDPSAKYKTVNWFKDSYLPEIMKVDPVK